MTKQLTGAVVLLVEQDAFLTRYFGAVLEVRGASTLSPVRSVAGGMQALAGDTHPSVAALGTTLAEGPAWPLAEKLKEADIPFLFIADTGFAGLPSTLCDAPVLTKPCSAHDVASALAQLLEVRAEAGSGPASVRRPVVR